MVGTKKMRKPLELINSGPDSYEKCECVLGSKWTDSEEVKLLIFSNN
jgi:hypothetical protein